MDGHYYLGKTLVQQRRIDEGMVALREAMRVAPDSPWPRIELAECLLKRDDYREAITVLRGKPSLSPHYNLADAHLLLANKMAETKNINERARDHWKFIVAMDDSIPAYKIAKREAHERLVTIEVIREAAARIQGHVHRTPVLTSRAFNERAGCEVFFKCENLQRAGAFKIRGATNKILSLTDDEKQRGVAAFSSGNHAQAVALAAHEAGIKAVIAMPDDAPKAKVAATRGYGAEIVFYDRLKQDREAVAIELARRDGRVLVPPYDDYLILAGQATCGLELVEEVRDLDCLLTPCSGGGLFAGVSTAAKALNPNIRCFPVEPDTADDTRQSFLKGKRVTIPPPPTIADGLRVQSPGAITFPILQKTAEDVLTVSDEEIIETIKFFLFRMKLLVEPSGAAAAAAVLTGKLPRDARRVGVVVSGGNIDAELLSEFLIPKAASA
jgi:threonine dehydratase